MRVLLCSLMSLLAVVSGARAAPTSVVAAKSKIAWQTWSDDIFVQAKKEKRLILLDLEAVWCHWCHVMDERTYSDPRVKEVIAKSYLPVRVDQASRPDLADRYQDYGWPATIVLNADGQDLWKESGFISAEDFVVALKRIARDPSATAEAPKVIAAAGKLTTETRGELVARHYKTLDEQGGGTKSSHRFLTLFPIEYSLLRAAEGAERDRSWVRLTLEGGLKLIDPAWGGIYQYSTDQDWDHPHFEKIVESQANAIVLYSRGFSVFGDPRFLQAAQRVREYLQNFLLSPEGAFYASQDADLVRGQHSAEYFALSDAERRARGIPQVDKSLYARENGLLIAALTELYSVSNDPQDLRLAENAARWVLSHRMLPKGGFAHGEKDGSLMYLADNTAMLRGLLGLYQVTGERSWLAEASKVGTFMSTQFVDDKPGVLSSRSAGKVLLTPVRLTDQNADVARAANRLFQYTGDEHVRALAEHAERYVSDAAVALEYRSQPAVLLVNEELNKDPLHITVIGHKDDAGAREIFLAGLRYFSPYKRIEWWDKREGELPRADVGYPELPSAAGFVCTNKRCSLPLMGGKELIETIERFRK